jgi:site-specific DNA recombinase
VAQFDNDVRSQRVTHGMKAAVQAGRWPWQAPLGYRNNPDKSGPSLVLDPDRAPLLRQAFEARASGRTVKEIHADLTAHGLRTRKGERLSKNALDKILHNRVYAGTVHCKTWRECVPGDFEPIVSGELFDRVQWTLGRKEQSLYAIERHVVDDDFPLRRFVRCAHCQTVLTGSRSTGRSGERYAYYHCPKGHVRAAKATLEQAFVDVLERTRPSDDFATILKAGILKRWHELEQTTATARTRHQKAVDTLRARLRKLDAAFLDDRIDDRTYYEQRDDLRRSLDGANIDLAAATVEDINVAAVLDFGIHVLRHSAAMWTTADTDMKIRLQWAVFPTGLTWDGLRVGTAVTCLAFYGLDENRTENIEWCALVDSNH